MRCQIDTAVVGGNLLPVFESLLKAFHYSRDIDCSVWDFSIPIRQLIELGASDTDLRWLVLKGLVEHGREVTVEGDNGREFRSTGNLTFCRQTCFVLTDVGVHTGQQWCSSKKNGFHDLLNGNEVVEHFSRAASPCWDAEIRKLRLGDRLVKRFKWPASNQETVLAAFEEEGWPERIDDPLKPQPEQDSKRRLADTIKCLNRKQLNALIHFSGDGTGEGVLWELTEDGNLEHHV